MEIVNKDLNLLKVLVTVGETLNLTRASESLNLSQPALSYSLKKLREDFQDPLFVRTSHGFLLTPKAEELLPRAKAFLESSRLLYSSEQLNLKTHKAQVRLAFTGYFESLVIPELLAKLNKQAPLVRVKTLSLQGEFPKQDLENGKIDLAVAAYFGELPEAYFVRSLGKERQVIVMRKHHPYLKSKKTLSDYLSFTHIRIALPIDSAARVDQILLEKKMTRTLAGEFNNFLSPLVVVQKTDHLLTIPEKLAKLYQTMARVEILELPMKEVTVESKMVWHARFQNDPFHKWLREIVYQSRGD